MTSLSPSVDWPGIDYPAARPGRTTTLRGVLQDTSHGSEVLLCGSSFRPDLQAKATGQTPVRTPATETPV